MDYMTKKTFIGLPFSLFLGIVITVALFMFLPILTEFQQTVQTTQIVHAVLISQRKPAPPPPPEQDKELEQQKFVQPKRAKLVTQETRSRIVLPTVNLGSAVGGVIAISNLVNKNFKINNSLFATAFNLSQVDKPPRILHRVQPAYPFEAKQKGISGSVMLQFVVTATGEAKEPRVISSKPKGVFDKAALDAIKQFTFVPAYKGGKPVDCIVNLPISFSLNQF